jgi:hypothetical protein
MTEAELATKLLTQLPTIAVAIGVAKIYMKVSSFIREIQAQVGKNSGNIRLLMKLHIRNHGDDAVEILEKKNKDG